MTTLENLYNGNINPCELEGLARRPEFSLASQIVSEARLSLEETLDD